MKMISIIAALSAFTASVMANYQATCVVRLDTYDCYTTAIHNHTESNSSSCMNIAAPPVCRKQFNITYVSLQPYSTDIVGGLLRICCGACVNATQVRVLKSISELTSTVMNQSHFVFPVLGRAVEKIYGYSFLPLIKAPLLYYITRKPHQNIRELVLSCLSMWPLLTICALMVLISGFICWLMEKKGNGNEFPATFAAGWFEGIWWSFITMTTVGYGDKAPRSVPARLLSIVWVVVGMTAFSLITALLTTELSKMPAPPQMAYAKVGALRHHLYESIVIADQGGVLIDVNSHDLLEAMHEFIGMMKTGQIDGFVLDGYMLPLLMHEKHYLRYDLDWIRKNTQLKELAPTEQYVYGVIVRHNDDYKFLKDFVWDNLDVLNACNKLFLNRHAPIQNDIHWHFLFEEGRLFWPTCISFSVIILFIFIYGACFELRKRWKMGCYRPQITIEK